ncbi:MAG: hypothetical protein AAB066_05375, partial [Candidatus Margulisiibacteriota bacterium]
MYGVFSFVPDAEAVQIRRVQSGEIYFDADDITQVAEINAVDTSKTLVFLYPKSDLTTANARQNVLFTGDFGSSTELVISRDGATYAVTVRYYLVEFVDGVNVRRGISSFAAGSYTNPKYTTKDILMSPSLTDYTDAIALVQVKSALTSATADEIATVAASVIDNNTLRLERYATNDLLKSVNMVWQVAEFTKDATVKTGTATIAINSLTGTGTINPAIATLNKAFLLFSYKANRSVNGVEGREEVSGQITNATTVTFTRGYQNNTSLTDISVKWAVIELTDPLSTVQGQSAGALTVASGAASANVTLSPNVDPTRSVPLYTASGPLSQTATTYEDEMRFAVERDSPRGIVYDPGNNYVWVVNYHSNTVTKYNASTGALVGSPITVGTNPVAICYLSSTVPPSIWVANYGSNNVSRINTSTFAVDATVTVGTKPIDIGADLTSTSVWTANNGATGTANVVTKILASTNGATNYTGYAGYPASITYDPGSGGSSAYMWVGYAVTDRISRFLCTSGARNDYDIGATYQYYSAIVYAPPGFGGYASPALWTTSLRNNFVVRLTLNSTTHVYASQTQFGTELNPKGIDVIGSGATGTIAFTNNGSNSMNIMNPNDGTTTAYATQANPWGLSYDSTNSKIWVANASSGSFMKFDTNGANPVVYSQAATLDKYYFSRNNSTTTGNVSIAWFMPEFTPITLNDPNGAETWEVGSNVDIAWKYADALKTGGAGTGGVHRVKLELSNDDTNWYGIPGASTLDVSNTYDPNTSNDGKFTWTNLPASITGIANLIGTTMKVRISDIESGYTSFLDTSNANFNIKGQLTVDQPPNTWRLGETHDITWATKGNLNSLTPNDMTIRLSTDGTNFLATALTATANPGTDGSTGNIWSWNNIPSSWDGNNLIGTTNKVKLTLNYNASGAVESATANFTLKGRIYNVSPATSETWLLGDTKTITWSKKGQFGGGV